MTPEDSTMEKLSADDIREVLAEIPGVLESLREEVHTLREKVASYERREHAETIVAMMDEKGIDPGLPFGEKVAKLLNDPGRDLRVVEEAIRMDVSSMKLASVSEDQLGNGSTRLESYILGS